MEGRERKVLYYNTSLREEPFRVWRRSITDIKTAAVIDARIARLRGGNFGDSEPIGSGASENKIDFGPGYRIYYGADDDKIILLGGGDKATQTPDIKIAEARWIDYKSREKVRKKTERAKVLKNVKLQTRPTGRPKK